MLPTTTLIATKAQAETFAIRTKRPTRRMAVGEMSGGNSGTTGMGRLS
jgi:hypothetical protein